MIAIHPSIHPRARPAPPESPARQLFTLAVHHHHCHHRRLAQPILGYLHCILDGSAWCNLTARELCRPSFLLTHHKGNTEPVPATTVLPYRLLRYRQVPLSLQQEAVMPKAKGKPAAKGKPSNAAMVSPPTAAPPSWPVFRPPLPLTDLEPEPLLDSRVLLIRNFWPKSLCRDYLSLLRSLPLTTTPGKPKRGDAVRMNDRFQVQDQGFANRLWLETGLKQVLLSEEWKDLW